MRAPMHGMYLISAAHHTSIKGQIRRHPVAPCCASSPHTCVVDGDRAGDTYMQSKYSQWLQPQRQRNRDSVAQMLIT